MNKGNSAKDNLKKSGATQKTIISLEVKKEDRLFSFNVPTGASLGECYDACFECLAKILETSNDAMKSAQAKKDSGKKEPVAPNKEDK